MKLLFFEEELLLPSSDVNNQIYTKEMVADLSDKKLGVILGNNGYKTMLEGIKKAVAENYYCVITNQTALLNMQCFIDEDGTRDIYIASLKKHEPLKYIEDYFGIEISKNDDLELIYRRNINNETI